MEWDLVRCADNHFRRVVYGIGPYIADYPEQVLVAGIVNGWCPAYVNLPLSCSQQFSYTSIAVTQIRWTLIVPVPSHEHRRRGKSFFRRNLLTTCGIDMVLSMISVYVQFILRLDSTKPPTAIYIELPSCRYP